MANNRPTKPIKRSFDSDDAPPKPYALVPFPRQRPTLKSPVGHHRYTKAGFHGTLYLSLQVKTALHVSTGIVAMGSDVGLSPKLLIKTMTKGNNQLVIQGSSLKGCVRAIYETITNSTLGVITNRYRQKMPTDRLPCTQKDKLCPASLLFGAVDWKGLVHFSDAYCTSASTQGFMPSLYRPHPNRPAYSDRRGRAVGRKFYHNMTHTAKPGGRGANIQQAGTELVFKTTLQFSNLSKAQLGALLVALGQDGKHKMALKLGGGKPVGFGTVAVSVEQVDVTQNVQSRYEQYILPENRQLMGEAIAPFIKDKVAAAHEQRLIEREQLKQLSLVLTPEADQAPFEGMY